MAANSRHVSGVKGDHHPSWPAWSKRVEQDTIAKADTNDMGARGYLQQAGLSLDISRHERHLSSRGIRAPGGVHTVQQAGACLFINHVDENRASGSPGGAGDVEVGPEPLVVARGAVVPGAIGRIQIPGNSQAVVKSWGSVLIGREGPGREQQ